MLVIAGWGISCEIALGCISLELAGDNSTLVLYTHMAWLGRNELIHVCHYPDAISDTALLDVENYVVCVYFALMLK